MKLSLNGGKEVEDYHDLGLEFEEEGISILSDIVLKPPGDSGGASFGCVGEVNCTNS